ncbi:unnamed protein product [Didymodactylos carnosus]|uniref:HECT-type E3 ubiquitin transferase n=1 Tax=Didymodactylos carnosus TaxID=1234261 RepID=A0A8S2GFC3_9BILA|nr:unnamed protein product [Didymodactylos carnosus]CAF3512009.1 unnamed protein product [Didymodactylos carnosus]
MIEIVADILRGPVFLAGETLHCTIRFTNKTTSSSTTAPNVETLSTGTNVKEYDQTVSKSSNSVEKLSWASVQLHCQRYVNEQKVNLQRQATNVKTTSSASNNNTVVKEVIPADSTAFIATKGETGQTIYTSKPCVLFCDLKLQPGEISYSETIATHVAPSFRGQYVKYSYKLTIGTQRVNCPTTLIRVPFRVLVVPDLEKYLRLDKTTITNHNVNNNPFVSSSRTETDSLTTALDVLQTLSARQHQNVYNISNSHGRVCRISLFKNSFKLGEDILGIVDFDLADVPCVQYIVTLQSEEILNPIYRRKSTQGSNITSYTKQAEFCLSTKQSYLSLSVPLPCSPTFSMDLISLRWKLHFEFVTSKVQFPILSSSSDPSMSTTWLPSNSIDVETMVWDLPIKILPTNPYFANNVAKMTQAFLFTGQYRSHPDQDYSRVAHSSSRDDFINRTNSERKQRELKRQQLWASIKIQSYYRRLLAKRKLTQLARSHISSLIQKQKNTTVFDENVLLRLSVLLKFGFNPTQDAVILMSLIEIYWKHKENIVTKLIEEDPASSSLRIAIGKMLIYTVRCLSNFELTQRPIRFIEWFTDVNSYYTQMCSVIQAKVPSSVGKNSRILAIDPIIEMIARPIESISLDQSVRWGNCLDEAIIALRNELFSRSDLPALPLIITPALVKRPKFPILRYIELYNVNMVASAYEESKKLFQLHSLLLMLDNKIDEIPSSLSVQVVSIVRYLISGLIKTTHIENLMENIDDDDNNPDDRMDFTSSNNDEKYYELIDDCLNILDKRSVSSFFLKSVSTINNSTLHVIDRDYLINLAVIAHALIFHCNMQILRSSFLMGLSTAPLFLRQLWTVCCTLRCESDYRDVLLISHISCGSTQLKDSDINRIEPLLMTFCSMYSMSLVPLHDDEFWDGMPATAFLINEVPDIVKTLRDVCMGIIRYMYPDKQIAIQSNNNTNNVEFSTSSQSISDREISSARATNLIKRRAAQFWIIFKVIVQLLQQLRSRDVRRCFCPAEYWLTNQYSLKLDKLYILSFARGLSEPSLLSPKAYFNRDSRGPDPFTFSVTELRLFTILQQIPFVIPFPIRVQVLNLLIQQNKNEQQHGAEFLQSDSINVRIRREYIYEDAFEKLSIENEPNLRKKIRVSFINPIGLEEAGIDGGGLFREFMNELLKSAFNPIRGLFKLTSDGYLYPNPNIGFIESNFGLHYYFLGRMLGKAIYEKFLAELPFATFFLQKILSRSSGKVDIHHLASLDPEMYKNLLYLKNYNGNVEDLGLDFTIVNSEIGQTQINEQVLKFREGLGDVVNLEWLRMFDANELRILISGVSGDIDVNDWRKHAQYRAPYNKDHPVVQAFWRNVHDFTENQKRQLLKFTTSCSRPPLFGFKELYPEFCIQSAGPETDRLPTSNTCVNLLKLPEYQDENVLKEKLLYAIQSSSGFEFS